MLRQIIREELSAALRNIPQYADHDKVLDVNEVAELIGRSKSWITQNKDSLAVQLKLDELIRSHRGAHNALLDLEELKEEELEAMRNKYEELAAEARKLLDKSKKKKA